MTPGPGKADRRAPGHLFLAFLNSVTDDGKTRLQNSFEDGRSLVALLKQHGLADTEAAPSTTQLATLISLREAGYAALSAMAAGRPPGREEALYLETAMKTTWRDAQVNFGPERLFLAPGPLGGLQDHLVLSLIDLMQRADLSRLRECKRCTHLFLDHGRGRGRRWCSMARCGNRAKAESFRARQRAQAS